MGDMGKRLRRHTGLKAQFLSGGRDVASLYCQFDRRILGLPKKTKLSFKAVCALRVRNPAGRLPTLMGRRPRAGLLGRPAQGAARIRFLAGTVRRRAPIDRNASPAHLKVLKSAGCENTAGSGTAIPVRGASCQSSVSRLFPCCRGPIRVQRSACPVFQYRRYGNTSSSDSLLFVRCEIRRLDRTPPHPAGFGVERYGSCKRCKDPIGTDSCDSQALLSWQSVKGDSGRRAGAAAGNR